LPECRFDYGKARPNRFAARLKHGNRAVVLDPDVAAVFSTPESVNAVLLALIETMAQSNSRKLIAEVRRRMPVVLDPAPG
jgi:hypothetical protein